jgi:Zn-dependent M28 family amino/carboxypeptidase
LHIYQSSLGADTVRNIEATKRGTGATDEIVLVGAHYDSVEGTVGANDNASGVAGLLAIAHLLRDTPLPRTLRFVAFVNEEAPFFNYNEMGSQVYAKAVSARGDHIVAMLSLETIGFYSDDPGSQRYPFPFNLLYPERGNFIGFIGNVRSRGLVRNCVASFRRGAQFPSEGAAIPAAVPGVSWSDHASFWPHGVPAVMVTDTAPYRYPFYHTGQDTPDRIRYPHFARVVTGLAQVVRDLASD